MNIALTKDQYGYWFNIYESRYTPSCGFTIEEWFMARKLYKNHTGFKAYVQDFERRIAGGA